MRCVPPKLNTCNTQVEQNNERETKRKEEESHKEETTSFSLTVYFDERRVSERKENYIECGDSNQD